MIRRRQAVSVAARRARLSAVPRGAASVDAATAPGRVTGVVKWFNSQRGFGFVQRDDGQKDVFVHAAELRKSGITEDLDEGDRVELSIKATPRGVKAVDIVRVRP